MHCRGYSQKCKGACLYQEADGCVHGGVPLALETQLFFLFKQPEFISCSSEGWFRIMAEPALFCGEGSLLGCRQLPPCVKDVGVRESRSCPALWLLGLQHARLLCPPVSPRLCSNLCPLSQWCYLTMSSFAAPFSFCLSLSRNQELFQWIGSSHQIARVLELQHQSFQWIFRVDFLYDWLVWSPCSPRET